MKTITVWRKIPGKTGYDAFKEEVIPMSAITPQRIYDDAPQQTKKD